MRELFRFRFKRKKRRITKRQKAFYITSACLLPLLVLIFLFIVTPSAEIVRNTTSFPISIDVSHKVFLETASTTDLLLYLEQAKGTTTPDVRFDWIRSIKRDFSGIAYKIIPEDLIHKRIIINPGERKEEIAQNIGRILRWDTADQNKFLSIVASNTPEFSEGTLYPGLYTVPRDSSPAFIASLLQTEFIYNVAERYTKGIEKEITLNDLLTFASLLEREAHTFSDMRLISGIIWQRLFIDMKLQLDATLQYARGSEDFERRWWPTPTPQDKYTDSPFNTYQNTGLPPAPIGSPGLEALVAVLNPIPTECIFYFHDARGIFRCSENYQQHVQKLRQYYGQGQ